MKHTELNVSMWTNEESKNSLSHREGLNEDQIAFLRELKVGDRLIVFVNKKRDRDTSPHFTLKKFNGAPRAPREDDNTF